MFVLFCLSQKGTYLPQTYIIHEEMVVTGKVHNMRQLGPFIYRLCNGKDTYRLNRRVTHRRKPQRSMKTLHLIDASMVGLIVVIQAEVQPGSPPPPPPPPSSLRVPPPTGINKRDAKDCHHIRHFENTFVVETVICDEA